MSQVVAAALGALQGTAKTEIAAATAAIVDAVLLSALDVTGDDELADDDASLSAKPQLRLIVSAMADASAMAQAKRALGLMLVCDALLKLQPETVSTPHQLSEEGVGAADLETLKDAAVTCIASAVSEVAPALFAEVKKVATAAGQEIVAKQATVIVTKWRDQKHLPAATIERILFPEKAAQEKAAAAADAPKEKAAVEADQEDEDEVVASSVPIGTSLTSADAREQSVLLRQTLESLAAIPPAAAAPMWETLRLHEAALRKRTPEALEALRAVAAEAQAERRRRAAGAARETQAAERRVTQRHAAPDVLHPRPRPLTLHCDTRRLDLPPPTVPPRCTEKYREMFSINSRTVSAAGAAREWWPSTTVWSEAKDTAALPIAAPRPLDLKRHDDDVILF